MLYDSLLVIALLMLMTTFFVIAQGGEAVEPYTLPHQLASLGVVYGFFVFFWSNSGQTALLRCNRISRRVRPRIPVATLGQGQSDLA
jgi:hypothetical protein